MPRDCDVNLWLVTPCWGETLWAYNREHIEFLRSYIGARLRSHPKHAEHGWSNKFIQSRLPAWMLSRGNRDALLPWAEQVVQLLPDAV